MAETIEVTTKKIESLITSYTRVLQIERKEYLPQYTSGIISEKIMALVAEYDEAIQGRSLLINLLNESRIATIQSDWFCLELALRNLIGYAVNASPEGETVTISLVSTDAFYITISHRAVVPKENRAGFFTALSRANEGRSQLGLYIAMKMIKALNGQVSMKSSGNSGTNITIQLPNRF